MRLQVALQVLAMAHRLQGYSTLAPVTYKTADEGLCQRKESHGATEAGHAS